MDARVGKCVDVNKVGKGVDVRVGNGRMLEWEMVGC